MWTDTKVDGVDYIWANDWNDMAIAITTFINSKGVANGIASLDTSGHVPATQLPNNVVNVQSDWNESNNTLDAYILNKPTIPDPYILPVASESTLGGIKVGSRLSITDGVLTADVQSGTYELPISTNSILGGVKVGNNIDVTIDGTISVEFPTLPIATDTILGGIKVGSRLSITDGILSADEQVVSYTLPVATNAILGGVKIGSGVTIVDGVISATIPIQSDWNQNDSNLLDYIKNKPSIPN